MANIAKTYTLVNGQPADATQVNKNFDDIIAGVGDISAAGHALLDDADAAAQRATLGGVVVGPASATDNAIVRADGVTGKLVQNSDVFIDDAGNFKFRSAGGGVDPLGNLDWGNVGNAAINARISALRGASNYGQGNLIFSTSPDDSGTVERMRIDMNGAVTIGGQVAVVTNDARLSDARPASDVSAWAKAASKPTYTAAEVGTKKIMVGAVQLSASEVTNVTHGLGDTPVFVLCTNPTGNVLYTCVGMSSAALSFPATAGAPLAVWIAFA